MIQALAYIATIIKGLIYLAQLFKEHQNEEWAKQTHKFFEDLSKLDSSEKRKEAAEKINLIYRNL